jgi:hypothetical protein
LDSEHPVADGSGGNMTDVEQIAVWDQIEDPKEALKTIVEHEELFGYDSYYAELRKALLRMAERASK